MLSSSPLIVMGGNGLVGSYLLRRLHSEGRTAEVISRRAMCVPEGFTFTQADLNEDNFWKPATGATVISLLPLWILERFLPKLSGVAGIIAIGSTSAFSKMNSDDAHEREIAQKLKQGEKALRSWCAASAAYWTLLRTTLIYDGVNDKNIARMATFIRRFRFLPVAAPANGLRQPIHANDVARAVIACLGIKNAREKDFNIAGGEILTYRAMAERVFAYAGVKPRLLMLPTGLLINAFRIAAKMGLVKEASFGASIFLRMNQDLVFDTKEGLEILDYQPRKFNIDLP